MRSIDNAPIITFREAHDTDIPAIMEIMDSAREFQRSLGFTQWKDGYPSADIIKADMRNGGAKVFILDGKVAAYAFMAYGDPAYDDLPDEIWQFKGNYGVVHRLAISDQQRGRGLSSAIFRLIESEYSRNGIFVVRVDTGERNIVMQRIMDRNGYSPRGLHHFVWGPRLVYEKLIVP